MSTKCSIPGSWLNSSVQKLVLAPCVKQGVFKRHIILSVKRLFWLYLAQGARAGKGFNKLHQEVQHHHGVWGNSLDHSQCTISIDKDIFVDLLGEDGCNCMIFLSSHNGLLVTNRNLTKNFGILLLCKRRQVVFTNFGNVH